MGDPLEILVPERMRLLGRLEQQREQREILELALGELDQQIADDERMLKQIEGALGRSPELTLDDCDIRLRGQRLEEIAIEVLADRGEGEGIHYRDWFELLRQDGHLVAGKQPIDTFLAQINRSPAIERLGRRSGRYRLAQQADTA
jgi:hypothetical protein